MDTPCTEALSLLETLLPTMVEMGNKNRAVFLKVQEAEVILSTKEATQGETNHV